MCACVLLPSQTTKIRAKQFSICIKFLTLVTLKVVVYVADHEHFMELWNYPHPQIMKKEKKKKSQPMQVLLKDLHV